MGDLDVVRVFPHNITSLCLDCILCPPSAHAQSYQFYLWSDCPSCITSSHTWLHQVTFCDLVVVPTPHRGRNLGFFWLSTRASPKFYPFFSVCTLSYFGIMEVQVQILWGFTKLSSADDCFVLTISSQNLPPFNSYQNDISCHGRLTFTLEASVT